MLGDDVTAVDLVALLDGADLSAATDADLVHLVAGWQRAIGMVVSAQAAVVREQLARGAHPLGSLPDELAPALGWTRTAAQGLVVRAGSLGELPALDAALRAGDLDARRVDVALDELAALPDDTDASPDAESEGRAQVRERIVADLVGVCAGWTSTQVRRWVRRRVISADPDAAAARARREVGNRRVQVSWSPHAMAWVSAYLSAADAMLVRSVLDAAVDAHDATDPRTADQQRADMFASIFTGIADTGVLPCGEGLPAQHRVRPHLQVTIGAGTLLGLDEEPAHLTGYGPIPASTARAIATDATWSRLLTDPTGRVVHADSRRYRPGAVLGATVLARDVTCTFPGCVRPALGCEIDHITPFGKQSGRGGSGARAAHGTGEAGGAGAAPPADEAGGGVGRTTVENLHVACKRHHDLKTQGLWHVRRDVGNDRGGHGGGVVWTSRAGITYAIHPQPLWIDPASLHVRAHDPVPPPDRFDGPPPF